MNIDTSMIQAILLAVVSSSAFSVLITGIFNKKKNNAEAGATNVRSILDIDERIAERFAKLEARVATLESENNELKRKELQLSHSVAVSQAENERLRKENEKLWIDNEALREENETLSDANFELMQKLGFDIGEEE